MMNVEAVVVRTQKAMPALSIRAFRASDAVRWESYVQRCANATFFHRIGWREIMETEFRHRTHYLVAERGDAIVGVLPAAEVKSRLFGHSLVSLPFCVYGGPAADDAQTAQALIDAAERHGAELRVEHVELRNRCRHRIDWAQQDLYVYFKKPLLPDVEANLAAIPRKQRAMVRKGASRAGERHRPRSFAFFSRCMPTTCTGMAHRRSRAAISSACWPCSAMHARS